MTNDYLKCLFDDSCCSIILGQRKNRRLKFNLELSIFSKLSITHEKRKAFLSDLGISYNEKKHFHISITSIPSLEILVERVPDCDNIFYNLLADFVRIRCERYLRNKRPKYGRKEFDIYDEFLKARDRFTPTPPFSA
jgi:hypothetical protein